MVPPALLLHGVHKLHAGVGWIAGVLAEHHLPGFLAYGVFIGEVIAPVMVIIGYQTRIGAALIVGNMLVALVLGPRDDGVVAALRLGRADPGVAGAN